MFRNRRDFFKRAAVAGAAVWAAPGRAQPVSANLPVEAPDVAKLKPRLVDGVKEFELIAEPVRTEFVPGRFVDAWGYNGSVPGPTIEVNEGDRVRVVFRNRLPEMTALHWHGLEAPMEMDGSLGLGQGPIPPGGEYTYEFTLNQHGTLFYHSHFSMQEMMGQLGLFIVHPKTPYTPRVDRDFGILVQEWSILPNNTVPNTMAMEFNWLTFNGKSGPAATPMLVKQGERVRLRLVNLGMDHHPLHLHGNQFVVTGTEAGRIPENLWHFENTVLVGVGQARNIEFDAKHIGDWMLHCHMPHHMMNQMISMVGPVAKESAHAAHMTDALGFYPADDPAKRAVKGYPQDMWMSMDFEFDKPETLGLRQGWSGAMMGMMTLVRVLPPELFDRIQAQIRAREQAGAKVKHGGASA
jgi:FtsP/CotA-like multicopper oxidase with cupredoxin domain